MCHTQPESTNKGEKKYIGNHEFFYFFCLFIILKTFSNLIEKENVKKYEWFDIFVCIRLIGIYVKATSRF